MKTCFVIESGWIVVGDVAATQESSDTIRLHDASVVRKWNNGRGIGGIVKEKYKHEYTLDAIGDVDIRTGKILFEIPCEW